MNSSQVRQAFFDFFASKGHRIVGSAPIVLKDDPTLMFTNAGMNQFKDLFLGNKKAEYVRIANSQKCLRVSGKHNDLEEVGRDSYHHTMFEMLGNWSIGDYFKEEAIDYAWELLTKVYKLDPSRVYASVFGGDDGEKLDSDSEAAKLWERYLPKNRILFCSKKDNFWEMGETGPCGPCSELHYDMRSDEARNQVAGETLVNNDDPRVVEIWNLVFIQYNRKADGSLEELPAKHVDTGMGFERLVRALQMKDANYDTDIFSGMIQWLEKKTNIPYTAKYDNSSMSDIAMRVIADHLRAVSFAIADGEMPSNTGAGYVIRRILRRAIRYYFSYLDVKSPLIYQLVDYLAVQFKDVFSELYQQKAFVEKVIMEEEKSFLRTLEAGLKRLDNVTLNNGLLDGETAFELYDTFGFPYDLTRLIADEKGWTVDEKGFLAALELQKSRSRADAKKETGDWVIVNHGQVAFEGYDVHEVSDAKILKYRVVKQKDEEIYQVVLSKTPFYAEGGGQVGDTGFLKIGDDLYKVLDTKRENELIIHILDRLPVNEFLPVSAIINGDRREKIEANHSVTHLMHAALRDVLGTHVAQKGSLVKEDQMRFDFSHFAKMTDAEISKVEQIVNEKIREDIPLLEQRSISIGDAKAAGAMMLFGEKYGDKVRMITFDPAFSQELCGGCHVKSTGKIGLFKIKSEGAIAAGVRRIEVLTGSMAEAYINEQIAELDKIKSLFKTPKNTFQQVSELVHENKHLQKAIEKLNENAAMAQQANLFNSVKQVNGMNVISASMKDIDGKIAKTLSHNLLHQLGSGVVVLGLVEDEKCQLMVSITEDLVKGKNLNAGTLVRNASKLIDGGGGGQPFFATAGGKNSAGMSDALDFVVNEIGAL